MPDCKKCIQHERCDEHSEMIKNLAQNDTNIANLVNVVTETKDMISEIYGMVNSMNLNSVIDGQKIEAANKRIDVEVENIYKELEETNERFEHHTAKHTTRTNMNIKLIHGIYLSVFTACISIFSTLVVIRIT